MTAEDEVLAAAKARSAALVARDADALPRCTTTVPLHDAAR